MTKYEIYVEETIKNRRTYEIETEEDIDSILNSMERVTTNGFYSPSEFLGGHTEIELLSYEDETDLSSPDSIEYEIEDVMEDN